MKDINWAVLGTGVIANEMAVALKKNGKNIYAVGNRTYEKAVAFGEKYGIGQWPHGGGDASRCIVSR